MRGEEGFEGHGVTALIPVLVRVLVCVCVR